MKNMKLYYYAFDSNEGNQAITLDNNIENLRIHENLLDYREFTGSNPLTIPKRPIENIGWTIEVDAIMNDFTGYNHFIVSWNDAVKAE